MERTNVGFDPDSIDICGTIVPLEDRQAVERVVRQCFGNVVHVLSVSGGVTINIEPKILPSVGVGGVLKPRPPVPPPPPPLIKLQRSEE